MVNSMTGFGRSQAQIKLLGKVSVELKSSNHKFLDVVVHLPPGLLSLEENIKKEVESKIRRGRVTCVVSAEGTKAPAVFISRDLVRNYVSEIKKIKQEFRIKDELSINTLMHLPGVVCAREAAVSDFRLWPGLKKIVGQACRDLITMRQKEGRALYVHLKKRALALGRDLAAIRQGFTAAINRKLEQFNTEEERSSFLKESDITEEIERLEFHANNFVRTLSRNDAVGKELDFITQEMQREANTMGAKSCDTSISSIVIQIKSKIEKLREQLQNIE